MIRNAQIGNSQRRKGPTAGQMRSSGRKRAAQEKKAAELSAEAQRTGLTTAQVAKRRFAEVEAIKAQERSRMESYKRAPIVERPSWGYRPFGFGY